MALPTLTFRDILSSQATNKPELTLALFSDAQRIIYSLRLNAIHPAEGATAVDIEVGRRIFWHLYTTDKYVAHRCFTDEQDKRDEWGSYAGEPPRGHSAVAPRD